MTIVEMRDGFLKFKRDQGGEMRKFSASLERLGENIYEQPFTITDVFGNEEYVWKSLYVHGKPPRIKVDDGSCGKTVQACGARIVIEDASGIGTLEVTGPGIDNGSNLVESILEGSDPSPLLRVLARDPENGKGPLLSATLKLEHGIPGTQKFTVTAADCTSSNAAGEKNTCEVTFECSLPSSPPEVEWRNLPWRRVGDGDGDLAHRVRQTPGCVLAAERALAGARHRVLGGNGGLVDNGNVSAMAAAFKLEH